MVGIESSIINDELLDSLHNLEDKILKQIGENEINILLERLGLDFRVQKRINGELMYRDIERRLDYLAVTDKDEIIDIEFQSVTITEDDIYRFGEYLFLAWVKFKKDTFSIIITRPVVTKEKVLYCRINPYDSLTFIVCSLKDENANKVHDELLEKINKECFFTDKDITDFILYPLMETEREIEDILFENILLLNKINITQSKKEFIGSMILLEIHKFVVQKEDKIRLMRALNMKLDILYDYSECLFNEVKNEGKIEGEVKG
ncbi:MAG: hypothetical protein Q4P14_01385 [Methanobacteriaceae archaeon]|nr:hypothetical protein [Methanobacteriaceae archaeon]